MRSKNDWKEMYTPIDQRIVRRERKSCKTAPMKKATYFLIVLFTIAYSCQKPDIPQNQPAHAGVQSDRVELC
jgi:hypothetical protein